MNTYESGSQNFANCGARNSPSSAAVTAAPGFSTTHAAGRSSHCGCGTATTAAQTDPLSVRRDQTD